jgi:hypothetical protein
VKQSASLILSLLLWGCDDPLKSVELVSEPRVLGARVEVAADPGRAAPAPGESASVSFLLAAPELSLSLGFALAVCPAKPGAVGRPACDGPVFGGILSRNGELATPQLDFDTPAELDPNGRLDVLGIICPEGSPSADGTSCDGKAAGTPVSLELELARPADVNLNPELEADSLTFDEQAWPELPPAAGDCSGLGYSEVPASSQHSIQIRLDEADRDALPHPDALDPRRESLQLAHFTTAGDLSRAFDAIAGDDTDLQRSVDWTAPDAPGLVRFWIVLRDFRGGSDFTERAVCVR